MNQSEDIIFNNTSESCGKNSQNERYDRSSVRILYS